MFKIHVNPESSDYLKMTRIVDPITPDMSIADMAISPVDGMGYALNHQGVLYQFDMETGASSIFVSTAKGGKRW